MKIIITIICIISFLISCSSTSKRKTLEQKRQESFKRPSVTQKSASALPADYITKEELQGKTRAEREAIYDKLATDYPSRCDKKNRKRTNSLSSPTTKVDLAGSPIRKMRKEPRYPPRAARLGLEGFVIFEFDISEQGKVLKPSVIRSYPEDVFHKEAMRAFSQWTYKPTGKVISCGETSLYFLLAD